MSNYFQIMMLRQKCQIWHFQKKEVKNLQKKIKHANLKPDSKVIMYEKYFYRLKKCKKFTKKIQFWKWNLNRKFWKKYPTWQKNSGEKVFPPRTLVAVFIFFKYIFALIKTQWGHIGLLDKAPELFCRTGHFFTFFQDIKKGQ